MQTNVDVGGESQKAKRYAPVNFPERMAPPEPAQQPLGVGVEAGYVEGRGEGLDAVQSPWFTIVHRVCCDEVRHCYKPPVSTSSSLGTDRRKYLRHERFRAAVSPTEQF